MDGDWTNAATAVIVKSYFFVSVSALFNVATETKVVVKKWSVMGCSKTGHKIIMLKIKKEKYPDLCQSSIAIQIIYASDFLNKRFISLFSYPWRRRDRLHCQICAEVLDWSLKSCSFFRQISCNGNKSYNAVCKMGWLENRLNSSAGRSILIAKTNLHNWFSWSPEYIEANQWPVSRDNSRIIVRFLRRKRMF